VHTRKRRGGQGTIAPARAKGRRSKKGLEILRKSKCGDGCGWLRNVAGEAEKESGYETKYKHQRRSELTIGHD